MVNVILMGVRMPARGKATISSAPADMITSPKRTNPGGETRPTRRDVVKVAVMQVMSTVQ